ncbi:Alpha/Beta hydrolase protein [Dipodascopsis uninucleata]
MSDLQKNILKSKFSSAMPDSTYTRTSSLDSIVAEAPGPDEYHLSTASSSESHPDSIHVTETRIVTANPESPWTDYFKLHEFLPLSGPRSFHSVYCTPPENKGKAPVYFVFHHGAGSNALSFALVASLLFRELNKEVGMASIDCRDHGETHDTADDYDFRLDTLANDFIEALWYILSKHSSDAGIPEIFLVGHSLGGAVVSRAAELLMESGAIKENKVRLSGIVALDIVEGTALDGLSYMHGFLSIRPSKFRSLSDGIKWHIRSHTLRNPASACISVPPVLSEEPNGTYTWRTELARTEPFWQEWFKGMSARFLSIRAGKMLILAGTDRLDKELIIGQMQGKFQLEVVSDTGHFIQEDKPSTVVSLLSQFYSRNRRDAVLQIPSAFSPKFV